MLLTSLLCALLLLSPAGAAEADSVSFFEDRPDSFEVTQDSIRYYFPPQIIEAPRWNEHEVRSDIHMTVIGTEKLTRTAALDVGEAVAKSPGIVLTKTGGPGSQELVSIRGSTSQQVLVLLNGRRLNTAQGGGIDLSQFGPWDVSRIEIFPEGNDARFGARSMGGILNVVTAPAAETGLCFRTLGGSYGTRSASLLASGGGTLRFSATGSYREIQNDFTFEDPRRGDTRRRVNAGLAGKSFSGRLAGPVGGTGELALFVSASENDRGAPGSIEFPTPGARLSDDSFLVQSDLSRKAGQLALSFGGGVNRMKRRYTNPDPVMWADDLHENTTAALSIDAERALFQAASLGTGANVERDRLSSTTDGLQKRNSYAAYLSTTWRFLPSSDAENPRSDPGHDDPRLSITPGLRCEKVGNYGAEILPSVSSRLTVVRDVLILRGSVGRKFRPPSFDELFWPLSSGAEGNPDLRPERSRSAELSGTMYLMERRIRVRGTWFSRRLSDLIEWTPGAGGIWRPYNVGTARERGIELSGGYSGKPAGFLPPLSLEASHSVIAATDEGDDPVAAGKQLARRPVSVSSAVLEVFPAAGLSIGFSWTRMGKRYLTRSNTKWLEGHQVFDLDLKRELWHGTSLLFSVRNLGGKDYYDIDDFPVPGTTVMVALDIRVFGDRQ